MEFETWDESAWRPVVDVAMSCWQKGILCFSQAYCPSRTWRKRESSAARNPRPAIGQALVRSLFQEGKGGMFFFWERIFNLKIDDVGYFYVVFPQFSTTFSPVCVVQSKFWIVKHMKPLVSLFFSNRQLGVKKTMEKTMALQLLEPSGGLSGPPGQPLGAALRHREGGRGWLFLATGGGSL